MAEKLAYSITEAAEAMSLSRSAVKELVYQNKLGSVRVGRRRIIPRWALEQFLNNTEGRSAEPDADWDRMLETI